MTGPVPDDEPLGFDALSEDSLRAARSLKWTRYGPAIGAFVAEMDFGTAPAVTAALHDAVDRGQLGYLTTEAATDMARACAGWQLRRYGWSVPPERITPLADVVAGLQVAIERFTPPGRPSCCPRRPTCRSSPSPARSAGSSSRCRWWSVTAG